MTPRCPGCGFDAEDTFGCGCCASLRRIGEAAVRVKDAGLRLAPDDEYDQLTADLDEAYLVHRAAWPDDK